MAQVQSLIDGGFNRSESRGRIIGNGDIPGIVKRTFRPRSMPSSVHKLLEPE